MIVASKFKVYVFLLVLHGSDFLLSSDDRTEWFDNFYSNDTDTKNFFSDNDEVAKSAQKKILVNLSTRCTSNSIEGLDTRLKRTREISSIKDHNKEKVQKISSSDKPKKSLVHFENKVVQQKPRDCYIRAWILYQKNLIEVQALFNEIDPDGFNDTMSRVSKDANAQALTAEVLQRNQAKLEKIALGMPDILQAGQYLLPFFNQKISIAKHNEAQKQICNDGYSF